MPRERKDAKYLNVHIERELYERLEAFCKEFGQTKTAATEFALNMYMTEMTSRMKGRQTDAKEDI
jgi:predicted DNA-binding protein